MLQCQGMAIIENTPWLRRRWITLAGLVTSLTICAAGGAGAQASPAPVPCSAIGGGKYDCQFYPSGDGVSAGAPVQATDSSRVGYLNHGTNWVICERQGATVISGPYENGWWAWTEANDGSWGWVNAVWASGGDNFGDFQGVPGCADSVGLPPGAQAPPATSGSTVTPPVSTPAPSPPTSAPVSTPSARRHLRVQIQLSWHVAARRTRVLELQFLHVPGGARIRLGCRGRSCRLAHRALTVKAARRALARSFTSGDVLRLTISRSGYVPEVAQLQFRTGRGPLGRVVSR